LEHHVFLTSIPSEMLKGCQIRWHSRALLWESSWRNYWYYHAFGARVTVFVTDTIAHRYSNNRAYMQAMFGEMSDPLFLKKASWPLKPIFWK